MTTSDMVQTALKAVIDPEIGLNIVDLGLIYHIDITPTEIRVVMTLTTPGCPLHQDMQRAIYHILQALAPDKKIDLHLVWNPPWTPEHMTPSARAYLGL